VALFDTGRGRFFGGGGVLETNIIGDDELERGLVRLSNYIEDVSAPLLAAKAIAQADMREKFAQDTGPEGQWKPLSEHTIDRKKRSKTLRTHPDDILSHTGYMERMARHDSSYRIVSDELIFTTQNLPFYWDVHESGSGEFDVIRPTKFVKGQGQVETGEEVVFAREAGRGKATPRRPFIGLTEEAEYQIAEVFEVWYEEGVDLTIHPTTGVVQERVGGRFGRKLFPAF
jgi:Phage virion morphogenesis family